MDRRPVRHLLRDVAHRLERNQAPIAREGYDLAAVDGHELFSSRQRCRPECPTRTIAVERESVTEYYRQAAVCQLIGQDPALVLDVELLRPARGKRPPPSGCSSGSSPSTRGSSTSSWGTPCISMPPSSTSAGRGTST